MDHAERPYGPAWKSSVDHSSEEWRAYCEAQSCVRRFLENELAMGRTAAGAEWRSYLDLVKSKRGEEGARRLEEDFRTIGIFEAADMRVRMTDRMAPPDWNERISVEFADLSLTKPEMPDPRIEPA